MADLQEDLAAQYTLARYDRPDDDIEDIVALIAERMGMERETELASESLAAGGDVDVIRQFVYEMEASESSDDAD